MSQSSSTELIEEPSTELSINHHNCCRGTTKKGEPCKLKIKYPAQYCKKHAKLFKYPKPAECPYCCESSNSCNMNQPLSCGHWMCRSCMLRWKTECPECRRPLQVTKSERKVMQHNTPISHEDQEAANMQAAIQVFLNDLEQIQQEESEPGDLRNAYWNMMSDEEGGVDLLSALIVGQAIGNLNRATNQNRPRFWRRNEHRNITRPENSSLPQSHSSPHSELQNH